jgi:uncharacterized protein (DUF1778 family)
MTNFKNRQIAKKRWLIQFRTTEDEKAVLQQHAKSAGMNVTDFIKSRTLDKPPKTKVATFDREVLIRLLAELGKIGSNVNQIAKAMNANKALYSVTIKESYIAHVLSDVQKLSNTLLDELSAQHEPTENVITNS